MRTRNRLRTIGLMLVVLGCALTAQAALISVSQNNVPNLDPIPPQIEPLTLGEESFAFVDRNHELTSARYDPATGLLNTASTGTLVGFPSYLIGIQYVANANDNKSAGTSATQSDYLVTYKVDKPSQAYLLLDNRLDGAASNVSKTNTTDPVLEGSLAWVVEEGWVRVNTGIMPNGQADYIGIDEGGSVAGPDARNHHDPGPGMSLNQFYAIYTKMVSGEFVTHGQKMATGSGNMYVVAVVPEPATFSLLALGSLGLLARRCK